LFVDGTLKSGFHNRYARQLKREARLLGPARMPGRLYRIRWYPGMRPARDPKDLITGELYKLRQPAKTLEALDKWEESYDRELHRVTLVDGQTGQTFRAWVYVHRRRLSEDRYLPSGEWL